MYGQADSGEVGDDDNVYDECTGLDNFIDSVVNDETDDITDDSQQTQSAAIGQHLCQILVSHFTMILSLMHNVRTANPISLKKVKGLDIYILPLTGKS